MLGVGEPAPHHPRTAAADTRRPRLSALIQPAQPLREPASAALRFRWQRVARHQRHPRYRLFIDGKQRKTVKDKDGPGGRDPEARGRACKLGGGRHRWFVRAYDYAGNHRTSKRSRRKRSTSERVVAAASLGIEPRAGSVRRPSAAVSAT